MSAPAQQQPDVVAGLRFLRPDFGARTPGSGLTGKRCFGKLLCDPQFTTTEGFAAELARMERAETSPVYRQSPHEPGRFEPLPRHVAVQGAASKRVYAVVSDKYAVVQDDQAFWPAYLAAKERGLTTVGRIDGAGTGRTTGHVLIANPEYTIRLLDDVGEDVMLGVRLWNSYTGDMSFGGEVFGVRTVCVNYNLWGSILGRFRLRHQDYEEAVLGRYERLVDGALDASSVLKDLAHGASQETVVLEMVPDMLWGAGLGADAVRAIMDAPQQWEPSIDVPGGTATAWQVYNAATAYVTYRAGGADHPRATEDKARAVVDLLTGDADQLADRGRARREAYEAYLEDLRQKRAGAIVEVSQ